MDCKFAAQDASCDNHSDCSNADLCDAVGDCLEGKQCPGIKPPVGTPGGPGGSLTVDVGLSDPTGTGKASFVAAGYDASASGTLLAGTSIAADTSPPRITNRVKHKLTAKNGFHYRLHLRLNQLGRDRLKKSVGDLQVTVVVEVTDRQGTVTVLRTPKPWAKKKAR